MEKIESYIKTLYTIIDYVIDQTNLDDAQKKELRGDIAKRYIQQYYLKLASLLPQDGKKELDAIWQKPLTDDEEYTKVHTLLTDKLGEKIMDETAVAELENIVGELIGIVDQSVDPKSAEVFKNQVRAWLSDVSKNAL